LTDDTRSVPNMSFDCPKTLLNSSSSAISHSQFIERH